MRVNRLLSIILIISNKGIVTGNELAEHFEVSLRTIYRDMEKLCEAGIPIASAGGKGGGFYIIGNYNLDNLFLDKNELQAIMQLMNDLKLLFGRSKQFDDLVLKLENKYNLERDMSDKLKINISHFSMEDELKEYLYLISKAIDDNKELEFDYINRRMECSSRTAQPIQIRFMNGVWWLVAFCKNRNDYRRFMLLRIRKLKIGSSFIKSSILNNIINDILSDEYYKKSIKVTLRYTLRIREHLTEHFTKDRIQLVEDGIIVEEYFPYEEGLIKFILSFGDDCEVLEPQYLRNEVEEYLKAMCSKYSCRLD